MSTSAVSSTSLSHQLQQYFQTRQSDLKQLGQSLTSGDLSGAQSAFNSIVSLGQNGPFAGGNPFKINQREQDFTALGQALQAGDLAGAQQAFNTLENTFRPLPSATPSSSGPEIILNLSNNSGGTSPEQITINVANAPSGGGEQVSLSVGNQGSNPEPITFNLGVNTNEQIVLNLLSGSPAATPTSGPAGSTSSGSALSVSA